MAGIVSPGAVPRQSGQVRRARPKRWDEVLGPVTTANRLREVHDAYTTARGWAQAALKWQLRLRLWRLDRKGQHDMVATAKRKAFREELQLRETES